MSKMPEHHRVVLAALGQAMGYGDNRYFLTFQGIQGITGMERQTVRRICRHLARRGFAEYGKGLFTDEGELAGAGYRITAKGEMALGEGCTE